MLQDNNNPNDMGLGLTYAELSFTVMPFEYENGDGYYFFETFRYDAYGIFNQISAYSYMRVNLNINGLGGRTCIPGFDLRDD